MNDAQFKEGLLTLLERKDHPAWPRWTGPQANKSQLKIHFQQEWLVFVRDFPRFLGRVHGNCPVPEVRQALAANIYEEETGGLSFHQPHPELFLEMMEALGYSRAEFEEAKLLPEAATYRAFLDQCMSGDWVIGAAIVTIWIEGSRFEREALAMPAQTKEEEAAAIEEKARTHFLVRHHGVRPEQLRLMRAHALVEGGHRDDAWEMVLGNARSAEQRATVLGAIERAAALWHGYRDAVTRAAGI